MAQNDSGAIAPPRFSQSLGLMSMHVDIFIEVNPELQLKEFAPSFFSVLGIVDFEQRQSSHYIGDFYFVSNAGKLEISVCYTDDSDLDEYRFWVHFTAASEGQLTPDIVDAYAKLLVANGWRCFVPSKNWAQKNWNGEGVKYEP